MLLHALSAIGLRDSPWLSVTIAAGEDAMFRNFLADQRGATAVEYCLLAMFLSITIVAGARAIGTNMSNSMYGPIATNLN
jgi:pilus assembly protein Flp/PilA